MWKSSKTWNYTTGELKDKTIYADETILNKDDAWVLTKGLANNYLDYLTIRWSNQGQPLTWDVSGWLNMDKPVTGIGTTSNGILIFSQYEVYSLLGTELEPFTLRLVSASSGCVDFRSIQTWKGICIFASIDGVCITDGGDVTLLTYPKLGISPMTQSASLQQSISDSLIVSSAVVGNTYFLLYKSGYILKIDLDTDIISYISAHDLVGIGQVNGRLGGASYDKNLFNLRHLIAGDKQYALTTGKKSDGDLTNLKEYDKVRVMVGGYAYVTITIDSTDVISNYRVEEGVTIIGIPNENCKGYSIQFTVTGVGKLQDINYTVKGRDNA